MVKLKALFDYITQDVRVGLIILFVCCVFTILAAFFDMWTKIEAVKAIGGKIESRPMAKTGDKIKDYLRLIIFVLMIDILGLLCFHFYTLPFCVVAITIAILIREGLSMYENYKLKKSNAVEVMELSKEIIQCLTETDARKLIKSILELNSPTNKKNRDLLK